RLPDLGQTGRFWPKTKHVVIVILEDDAPAGPHCANHPFYDLERFPDMLEEKARVGDVERGPLMVLQRQMSGVATTEIEQIFFAGNSRLPCAFGDLVRAALHADGRNAGDLGDGARKLAEPRPHVEH